MKWIQRLGRWFLSVADNAAEERSQPGTPQTTDQIEALIEAEVERYLPETEAVHVAIDPTQAAGNFTVYHGQTKLGRISGEMIRESLVWPERNPFVVASLQKAGCRLPPDSIQLSAQGRELCRLVARRSALYGEGQDAG